MNLRESRMLRGLLYIVVLLSPLTMFRISGMNLQPWSFLFPILTVVIVIKKSKLAVAPTSRVLLGEALFIFAIALSLIQSPYLLTSLFDSTQYLVIFFSVIPLCLMLFDTRRSRWIGTALLSLSFGSIGIIHTIILVFGQNPTIGYGNENIPQVMTCAGAILWGEF